MHIDLAGESVRRDVIARADGEAAEVRARAEADIALQRERAMSEIRGDVAQLAVELAERIVERSLDHDTQLALVDSFIQQVPGSS
jgi:F-type H+-transporting ATPase subunit b